MGFVGGPRPSFVLNIDAAKRYLLFGSYLAVLRQMVRDSYRSYSPCLLNQALLRAWRSSCLYCFHNLFIYTILIGGAYPIRTCSRHKWKTVKVLWIGEHWTLNSEQYNKRWGRGQSCQFRFCKHVSCVVVVVTTIVFILTFSLLLFRKRRRETVILHIELEIDVSLWSILN